MSKARTYRRNLYHRNEVIWHLVVTIVTLYAVYRIPTDLVLGVERAFGYGLFDGILTALFLADPIITILYARTRGKVAVTRYFKHLFAFDFIAVVALIVFPRGNFLELFALVKVVHATYFVTSWRWQLMRRSNLVRLMLFVYWLVILIHVTACGWLMMREQLPIVQGSHKYIEALYWAVTTLTTIGYGDIVPQTHTQMMFAIVVMLTGFVMMGYLIGNIAGLLNKSDPLRAQYAAALEEVSAFVQYHNLPRTLTQRIVDYFGYMWRERATFDEPHILNSLPSGIRSEVSLYLKRDVIQRVPFFREGSEQFIREVANLMRPLVATPGELVFHYGEAAKHMYFISHGTLDVLDQNMKEITTLSDGDFFGEMALLEKRRRSANVRARDYCNLYVLDAESFDNIVDGHPEFKQYMQTVAKQRQHTSNPQS